MATSVTTISRTISLCKADVSTASLIIQGPTPPTRNWVGKLACLTPTGDNIWGWNASAYDQSNLYLGEDVAPSDPLHPLSFGVMPFSTITGPGFGTDGESYVRDVQANRLSVHGDVIADDTFVQVTSTYVNGSPILTGSFGSVNVGDVLVWSNITKPTFVAEKDPGDTWIRVSKPMEASGTDSIYYVTPVERTIKVASQVAVVDNIQAWAKGGTCTGINVTLLSPHSTGMFLSSGTVAAGAVAQISESFLGGNFYKDGTGSPSYIGHIQPGVRVDLRVTAISGVPAEIHGCITYHWENV
jgi:hypothetical protein